ncbi:TonB-dependent receptor domain-containing protein [Mucilaginibacter sp. McL0603]|uniref:TonB-dependent receptor domain-containing protein n=1 Tax=Mucilaginibacter sp. McL0603 TaxID=3415670 RepID=UPI003CF78030
MSFNSAYKIFFSLLLFFAFEANAQQSAVSAGSGTISGKLIDASNNQTLPFASVALTRKSDNKALNLQTDINGNFTLTDLADGIYAMKISFTGYLTIHKDNISISENNRVINLGTIKISPAKGVLKEVVISSHKDLVQVGIDKKSFSVDQSLVSQGGSATDLLTNIPTVQVDVDGNVSLRGSNNVKVLINGKPSALTGNDLTDILQSIPASSIETIEVITNPSAKYDSEGDSGIINIILKKNVAIGFNGSASASVGTHNTYNGTLNLAYQNSKINIYTNYSYRKADRIGNGSSDKTTGFLNSNTQQEQNQVSDQKFTFSGHNIRSGIDYNIDPKTTISFSDNINIRDRDRDQNGNTQITNDGALLQTLVQNNTTHSTGTNLDFNLDFNHKFKKKDEELTANIGYSTSHDNEYDYLNTAYSFYNPDSAYNYQQNNHIIGHQHNWNLQADYVLPLNNNNKLEMGYRSTFSTNDNNYLVDTVNSITQALDYDPVLSNHFIYHEQVHAIYTNYQQQFGKFGIQAGLRLEEARINTTLTDTLTEKHSQNYLRLYPSLFLTEKLTDNQTLQFSYSRRVTRPRGNQISPFIDKSDPLNYTQGNPNLQPQDIHSFELSYINYWKTLTLTSSLYYRLTNDNIQRIISPVTSEISLTQFENVKSASNAGYELIAKVSPSNTFDLTGNLNIYYKNIDGDPSLGLQPTSGFSWNANLTANIKPFKKLGFQIRGDYQGPQVIPQGRADAVYGIDGGVRYDISKKLSFSFNGRDLLNTRKFANTVTYNNPVENYYSNQYSQRRFATGVYIATLSYRFGGTPGRNKKDKSKDQQQQDQDVPDDTNSAPTGGGAPAGGGPAMQR